MYQVILYTYKDQNNGKGKLESKVAIESTYKECQQWMSENSNVEADSWELKESPKKMRLNGDTNKPIKKPEGTL